MFLTSHGRGEHLYQVAHDEQGGPAAEEDKVPIAQAREKQRAGKGRVQGPADDDPDGEEVPVVLGAAVEGQGYPVHGGRRRVGDDEGQGPRRQPLVRVAEEGEGRGEVQEVALVAGVVAADGVDAVDPPGVGGGQGWQVHGFWC